MDISQIEADLERGFSDDDSDDVLGFSIPSFEMDDEKNKKKKKKKKKKDTNKTKNDSVDTPKKFRSSSLKKERAGSSKKTISHTLKATSVGSSNPKKSNLKKSSSKKDSKKKKGHVKTKTLSKKTITTKPSNSKIHLRGRSKKRFENIYEQHEDDGISLSAFKECVKELDLVDDLNTSWHDVDLFFQEATGQETIADFTMFLQALALLAIRRFPDGLDEDASAALGRLLDSLGDEEDEQDYQAKQRAVLQAKHRAAQRLKASKLKEQENIKAPTLEEQEQHCVEEQKKQEKIAQQRAYLRAKARLRSQAEKEKRKKDQEEKDLADAEEKKLVQAKLRKQVMKQAIERTKKRLAEYKNVEREALEKQTQLALQATKTGTENAVAVGLAEERVKNARKLREEQERLQKKQKEKEAKSQEDLDRQQRQMSAEKVQKLLEKTRERLKAKLEAEKKQDEREKQERKERHEKYAATVAEAVSKAEKRTSVKKQKIHLDDETERDLRKLFEPFTMKDKLGKVQWKDFVQKNRLCDGYNLGKSDLDLLFSKACIKGKRSLEFKQFCKAVAALGNKRFPVKKNTDPNDAIDRVLEATVRKNDPEKVKERKAELRKKRKEHNAKQRALKKQEKNQQEAKLKKEFEMQEKLRASRKARLQEQIKEVELKQKEHEEQVKKQEQKELRLKMEEEKMKQAAVERLHQVEKNFTEAEPIVIEAKKRAQERLKAYAQYEAKMREKKAKMEVERARKDEEVAKEGVRKAKERVKQQSKKKLKLGKEDENNLRTLYEHYKSAHSFNRPDWINCTETLGLMDEAYFEKSEIEKVFNEVKRPRETGINFKEFCSALAIIAQKTHPGEGEEEKDGENTPSKCLERLLFEIMGGIDDAQEEFDPTLSDSYMDGFEETEEEKATRLAEEKALKKAKREAKKKRDKEAKLRAEKDARIEEEKKIEARKKIEEARKKAANRVHKRKKEEFTISEEDIGKLSVYYEYFKISPSGMSRGDWFNCLSTLSIMDDKIIQKIDCEELFDELCTKKTSGLSFKEFTVGLSLLAVRRYNGQQLNQTNALIQLIKQLVDET